jgi:fructokinase
MSPTGFLVVGEALVDVIHRDGLVARHPGGSPTNVAVGLARLGHVVTELCYLGSDSDGELVRQHLHGAGIRLHPTALTAPATSVADVTLDASGDATYRFSVEWDVPTSIDWSRYDVVHIGSIGLSLEPGAGHLLELIAGRPEHVRLTVDPNVRAVFVPAQGAAERLEPFFAVADLVKLSIEDAEHLYPGIPVDGVLDRLLGLGPRLVALTLGADGVVLATGDARVRVAARAPRVVDTVGAGDSFMAALISAVAETGDWTPDEGRLESFGEWASRAAGITVSRPGADPPTREEMA